ncbi:hypothetical protein NHQ30_002589 [Ciborinia camelliae]|nr:hypothetical protein NHQ30_002589 [Ciborinia camelliae]
MSDLHLVTMTPTLAKEFSQQDLHLSLEDYSNHVQVIVGTGKEKVQVIRPAKILSLESNYFRIVCIPIWPLEKRSNLKVNLLDQDVIAFNIFLAWITTRNIQMAKQIPRINTNDPPAEKLEQYEVLWDQLLECYFLSEYLEAPNFGNTIIDAMIKAQDDEQHIWKELQLQRESEASRENQDNSTQPSVEMRRILGGKNHQINRLYAKTTSNCLLRNMMVHQIVSWKKSRNIHKKLDAILNEDLEAKEAAVPFEFTKDLLDFLVKAIEREFGYGDQLTTSAGSYCDYHVHKDGEFCQR